MKKNERFPIDRATVKTTVTKLNLKINSKLASVTENGQRNCETNSPPGKGENKANYVPKHCMYLNRPPPHKELVESVGQDMIISEKLFQCNG